MACRAVIVCALEIERRALARNLGGLAPVRRLGPGPKAMRALLPDVLADGYQAVVLAGVAGGLKPTTVAPPIARVIDRDGAEWTPTLTGANGIPIAILLGVDDVVASPAAKAELASHYNADLIDCESHAFAAMASAQGVAWAIARGVSDGPDDTLPKEASAWVGVDGRTRPARVAIDIVRRPARIGRMISLARRTNQAMEAVSRRVRTILQEFG